MDVEKIILKHALTNAIEYDGKANFQAVLGKVLGEDSELKKDIKSIAQQIKKILDEVNSLGTEKQKERLDELGFKIEEKKHEEKHELPPLANVGKKVIMRMAPYPSGPLHIGNSRMALLNDEYIKRYQGELILVIDDTIGSEEKIPIKEAYSMIPEGLEWLRIKFDKMLFKSDRMEIFYEYAVKLLEMGEVYVCECSVEKLRENRAKGLECDCRHNDKETNLRKWQDMLNGKYKEGEAIVRLKTDMQHKNPAFRDRVLLRISKRVHPRVGDKYNVWPMLEFSWAIDDHLLGITHILRGKDLIMEDLMEEHIWNLFGWDHPQLLHYGLLSLEGMKLSKSKAGKAIREKTFSGWDDPRTWSLQSLKRRGIRPETIRNFVLSFGMSLNDIIVPDDALYSENRKLIEPIANRYFSVFNPVEIKINQAPDVKIADEPLHPDYPERGKRKIPVNTDRIFISKDDFDRFKGKKVRLMGLFNVVLDEEVKYDSNEIVMEMPKIQWVSDKNVKVKIIMTDGTEKEGIAEPDIEKLKADDEIQMVRFGFARLDSVKPEIIFYFTHR